MMIKAIVHLARSPTDTKPQFLGWCNFPAPPNGIVQLNGQIYQVVGARWESKLNKDLLGQGDMPEATLNVWVMRPPQQGLVAAPASALEALGKSPPKSPN